MLICGPFHSTSNPMVGMAYLSSYLESCGIPCPTHDLNIESRAYLTAATGDRSLVEQLYSQSCRTYLAEAMVWSWHDPDGPSAIIRRVRAHPSPELRAFWEGEGIGRLGADPALSCASSLLQGWLKERVREIVAQSDGWVGFSTVITNLAANLFMARHIKERWPDVMVIMGGPEVTDRNVGELLASFPYVDAAIPLPAYGPLARLVKTPGSALTGPLPPGVWRRTANGIEGDQTRCWIDLDCLPPANWQGTDLRRYQPGFILQDPADISRWYPIIPLHTSQGCSYNLCDFCYNVALYPRFATQSPPRVLQEIRHQVEQVGSRGFFFTDFEFNALRSRVEEICRLIHELPYEIRFYAWLRLDKLDRPLLQTIYDAGCRQIFIGVEAVDDDILRLMHKGYNASFAIARLEMLQDFCQTHPDMHYEYNLICNYPGESLESVKHTLIQVAENPHLFYHRVAAVVEFMLHEGTFAHRQLADHAVGIMEPLLPPGAHLRSYRHVFARPGDDTLEERLEIWSAIRALVQRDA